jgi:hypothetical protein
VCAARGGVCVSILERDWLVHAHATFVIKTEAW